jgi:hypothetical protein
MTTGSMSVDEEVIEAVRRWWRAWVGKDLGEAEIAPGPFFSEASRLLGSGRAFEEDVAVTDWDIFDPVTEPLGGMVVVSYCFRISGKRGRRSFEVTGRATNVLSKENDRWTHLFHHGVLESGNRLPAPPRGADTSKSGD